MPVREVVCRRDVRAPGVLLPGAVRSRYNLVRLARATLLLALDAAALVCTWFAAVPAWEVVGVGVTRPRPAEMLYGSAVILASSASFGLYRSRALKKGLVLVWQSAATALVVIGITMMFTRHSVTPKSVVLGWLIFVVVDSVLRGVTYPPLRRASRESRRRPALVIGRPSRCARAAKLLSAAAVSDDVYIFGAVTGPEDADGRAAPGSGEADSRATPGPPVLGSLDDLEAIVACHQPTDLILADTELLRHRLPAILQMASERNLSVHMTAPEMGFSGTPVSYVPGLGMPVFVFVPEATRARGFRVKRALDFCIAAGALILLSPLLLLIAAAIKLTSPGPVLFVSQRVGLGQRRFDCYKFRTMYADAADRQEELEHANEADGALFKIHNDPRVTPLGRLLRRTSLDEIPQLINVLRGEMSLVGPRPLPVRDNELMEDWHKRRHVVLPGLTGPWQISGRSDLSFRDMIELDLRYVENWSLRTDLAIMGRTIGVILFGKGAY